MLREIWETATSLDFWLKLFEGFKNLGPIAPIVLAAIESLIPPLPLVAIVAINIASHGPFLGFLYSWIGTCLGCTIAFFFFRLFFMKLFVRFTEKHPKALKARRWVESTTVATLFVLVLFPFTPSAFVNFAFGISDFPAKKYLPTIYTSKLVMIGLLAAIGQSFVSAFKNPWMILVGVALLVLTYIVSRKVTKKKIGSAMDDEK
ncbi:MAG: VTT domain-containing protein [Lachnospiraceae bacterium]|nr:VTT domain-containing protein [Lachnospiraceae bacterium]